MKKIIIVSAIVLLLAVVGGLLVSFSDGFKNWDTKSWFGKSDDKESVEPEEPEIPDVPDKPDKPVVDNPVKPEIYENNVSNSEIIDSDNNEEISEVKECVRQICSSDGSTFYMDYFYELLGCSSEMSVTYNGETIILKSTVASYTDDNHLNDYSLEGFTDTGDINFKIAIYKHVGECSFIGVSIRDSQIGNLTFNTTRPVSLTKVSCFSSNYISRGVKSCEKIVESTDWTDLGEEHNPDFRYKCVLYFSDILIAANPKDFMSLSIYDDNNCLLTKISLTYRYLISPGDLVYLNSDKYSFYTWGTGGPNIAIFQKVYNRENVKYEYCRLLLHWDEPAEYLKIKIDTHLE